MFRFAALIAFGLAWMVIGAAAQTALFQSPTAINPWLPTNALVAAGLARETWIQPDRFFGANLDHARLAGILAPVPPEAAQPVASSLSQIVLPMPDGTLARFRIVESPVMAPALAAKFPAIRTYDGVGIDDPLATLRFDVTPAGFHAQILSPNGAVYIDPQFRGDTNAYVSYYKRDYREITNEFHCDTVESPTRARVRSIPSTKGLLNGGSLRTYRLAVAATAEYTQFQGGTVPAALAAIVTAINRVTGVYQTELSVRLVLIANEDLIIYTNAATQPYDNNNGMAMLSENQANLDSVIGDTNYDIGHVFSTGAGGIAGVGVICISGDKSRGSTGLSHPTGDAFYIDYVAHEIGHEFGAHHPFNGITGSCSGANRYPPTAFEPGSGSTIMAYAGICGSDNLQSHTDPYFHSASLEEIVADTTDGLGNGCAVTTSTANLAPVVNTVSNYTIPAGTPFILTAAGSDPNGDTVTYCWEERDLGPAEALGTPDNGSSPLFRSFPPTLNPSRAFPAWSNILSGIASASEELPVTGRTMNFRVTARDNRSDGGGVSSADTQVTTIATGTPFAVTFPANGGNYSGLQNITWNVAGTADPPIGVSSVNVLLSTNGGLTFPIVLATNVPNNGVATVILPSVSTYHARIEVQPIGNIFFAVNPGNFAILSIMVSSAAVTGENCLPANGNIDPGETVTVAFGLENEAAVDTTNLTATLLTTNGVIALSGPQTFGALAANGGAATNAFTFIADGTCGGTITAVLHLRDGAADLGTVSQTFILGTPTAMSRTVNNSSLIRIPAVGTGGTNPAASPYPSPISVSGIPGTITRVRVTLASPAHAWPDDIDVLLVGPGGTNVMLMSHTGGGHAVTNLTLTFDDAAPAGLPQTGALTSGTWQPTAFDPAPESFPTPAPPPPFGQTLSVFNGLDPNTTWSLYVQDAAQGDIGQITQGWSLAITTTDYQCCSGVANQGDLAVAEWAPESFVGLGSNVTFMITVTNGGPGVAGGIVVTDALPAALTFVSATTSQGSWTNENGLTVCSLGLLNSGGVASCSITATATALGAFKNTVTVGSATIDPVSANNQAVAVVTVADYPTISFIPDQSTPEGTPIGPIAFGIGSAQTPTDGFTVSAVSSDTSLVPNQNILLGGGGSSRTVTLSPVPNRSGQTTITLIVFNGPAVTTDSFVLAVTPIPPGLAAIPDATIHAGTPLVFTNGVTDPNVPPAVLTFSLDPGYPQGATVTPTTGVFTWTPTDSEANTTNVITVRVTDDGSPQLSDTQSFAVTVVPRMNLISITHSNGTVTITWSAIPNDTYRVQYKNSLNQMDWSNLVPDVTATDVTASQTDSVGPASHRFYRVILLDN